MGQARWGWVLLSPSEKHAKYVSELYNFESVEITDITVNRTRRGISIEGGGLSVDISWGIALPIPIWRPLWFIATVEAFFARMLFELRHMAEPRTTEESGTRLDRFQEF